MSLKDKGLPQLAGSGTPCCVKNVDPFSDPLIGLRHQRSAARVVRDGAESTDGQSLCQTAERARSSHNEQRRKRT